MIRRLLLIFAAILSASSALAGRGPQAARPEVSLGVDLHAGPAPRLHLPVWAGKAQLGVPVAPWLHLQGDLAISPFVRPAWVGFEGGARPSPPPAALAILEGSGGGTMVQASGALRLAATVAYLGNARRPTELRLGLGRAMVWSQDIETNAPGQRLVGDAEGRPAQELSVEVVRPLSGHLALAFSARLLTTSPLDEDQEPAHSLVLAGARLTGQLGPEEPLPDLAFGRAPKLASELVFEGAWETGQGAWRAGLPTRQSRLRLGLRANRQILLEVEGTAGPGLFQPIREMPSWFEGTGRIPPPRYDVVRASWPNRLAVAAMVAICPPPSPLPGHTWIEPRLRVGLRVAQLLSIRQYAEDDPDTDLYLSRMPGIVAGAGLRVRGRSRAGLDLDLRGQSRLLPDNGATSISTAGHITAQFTVSMGIGVAVSLGRQRAR